ncbi:MAG: TonB-dependent receptor [Gemmatimonadota bacterium]|nr:TonB-dependent receptor [Gemmatimonadota bacterium]
MQKPVALARLAICFAMICTTVDRTVAAQATAARPVAGIALGAIDGTVVDVSGASIPLVEVVMLDAPFAKTRTLSGGGYRIDSIPPGLHLLRFRRIGLVPTTVSVTVQASDVTGVDVIMAAMAHTLSSVSIQDTQGEIMRLPPDVADRVRNGQGTYITAADIERVHPIRTTQMFQYTTGTEVTKDGAVNSVRGIVSILTPGCKYGMPVFIDGARLADPHFDDQGPRKPVPGDTLHGSDLIDFIPPSAVAVIEVYRGGAELPATLPQSVCGGVFIWTKASGWNETRNGWRRTTTSRNRTGSTFGRPILSSHHLQQSDSAPDRRND